MDSEAGFIDNFVIDDQDWTIRYLVVRLGKHVNSRRVMVDPHLVDSISWENHERLDSLAERIDSDDATSSSLQFDDVTKRQPYDLSAQFGIRTGRVGGEDVHFCCNHMLEFSGLRDARESRPMLQKTAEYALRAIVCLAQNPQSPQSADRLAAVTQIPRRYLHRVLQQMVQEGLVRSQPGPNGGYSLNRPAKKIKLIDVINAFGPLDRIRKCPLGLKSHTGLVRFIKNWTKPTLRLKRLSPGSRSPRFSRSRANTFRFANAANLGSARISHASAFDSSLPPETVTSSTIQTDFNFQQRLRKTEVLSCNLHSL